MKHIEIGGEKFSVQAFGLPYPKGPAIIYRDDKPWAQKTEGRRDFHPVSLASGGRGLPVSDDIAHEVYRLGTA
jgi:hypothetical protein